MNIRAAKIEDLKSIVEIYNQAIIEGEKTADLTPFKVEDRLDWFKTHSPEKYPIYVAVESESILGYLSFSPYRPGRMALRFTAEVSYYIHYNHHRKGIASKLLKHGIMMCPKLGIKNIFAVLIDSNIESISILKKFGFKEWGHLPNILEVNNKELGHLYFGLRITL